ncbi:YtxH domain-containing protein [Flavobacterium sp. W1B]|uniref:YtxH domain-containing protein n=1 Tax=Flavobacterium sp. W1B TaxID=3394146 RepID=UPI0039BCA1E2
MKTDKVVLGILGGVAVGALLGILFAPEKGDKTRRKIKDKSNDYTDELKDKLDTLLGTITNKYEKIWKEGENLIAEGKSRFDRTKSDGELRLDDLKKEIKNSSI